MRDSILFNVLHLFCYNSGLINLFNNEHKLKIEYVLSFTTEYCQSNSVYC